jgi:hypothetical protein
VRRWTSHRPPAEAVARGLAQCADRRRLQFVVESKLKSQLKKQEEKVNTIDADVTPKKKKKVTQQQRKKKKKRLERKKKQTTTFKTI